MKKQIYVVLIEKVLLIIFLSNLFYSCSEASPSSGVDTEEGSLNIVAVTNISMNTENSSLIVGESVQLAAEISPSNATSQSVSWISSDETIASVDSRGLVTAVKAGNAVITVTTDDGGFTDTADLKVSSGVFAVESSYSSNTKLEILYDSSFEGDFSYIVSSTDLSISSSVTFNENSSLATTSSITSDDLLYDDYVEISSLSSDTLYYIYILNGNTNGFEVFTVKTNRSGGYTTETGTVGSGSDEKNYTIYYPADYDSGSSEEWPFLVSVKGPTMVTGNSDFPCIVFYVNNDFTTYDRYLTFRSALQVKLKSIIEDDSYHIDTSRMYTVGFSVGACWTFEITNSDGSSNYEFSRHMSSGGSDWLGESARCNNLAAKDVWLMCGENDGYNADEAFADMEAYLGSSVTGDHRLSVFPGLGHTSTPIWGSPVAWTWLLSE